MTPTPGTSQIIVRVASRGFVATPPLVTAPHSYCCYAYSEMPARSATASCASPTEWHPRLRFIPSARENSAHSGVLAGLVLST